MTCSPCRRAHLQQIASAGGQAAGAKHRARRADLIAARIRDLAPVPIYQRGFRDGYKAGHSAGWRAGYAAGWEEALAERGPRSWSPRHLRQDQRGIRQ